MDDGRRPAGGGTDVYAQLVPVASRYLVRLGGILAKLDDHVREKGLIEGDVLDTRLAPDMLPLRMHARIAMDFPFRALDQLVDTTRSRKPVDMSTLTGLADSLSERRKLLDGLSPATFDNASRQTMLRDRAGEAEVVESAPDFIALYVLPNFLFHLSATYLTCRVLGVRLSKGDFDAFHTYANAGSES